MSPPAAGTRARLSGRFASRHNLRLPPDGEPTCLVAKDAPLVWPAVVPAGWQGPVELEIGSGKGTFLVEAARSRPDTFFVGVEAGLAYARYCADRLRRQALANAVMVADDGRLFLEDTVPLGALARLHVYHPDPWPKHRHRKRRFFQPDLPAWIARALRPGGELLVSTDDTRYFGEILAVLGASTCLARDAAAEQRYGDETPGVAFGPTNFARKYVSEGRPRWRAVYRTASRGEAAHAGRAGWVDVAARASLPQQGGLCVAVDGQELALFADGDRVFCLENSCPHRGAALAEGLVRGGEVICPWHGWRYRLADGECSSLPGSMPARIYEVKVEGERVLVQMSEPMPGERRSSGTVPEFRDER